MANIALAIRTENLTKIYDVGWGRQHVGIDNLSLEVEQGKIFGLVGPNGSGKTTTLKLLLGLIFPTSGSGEVLGQPMGSAIAKARVGYLPEGPYFYEHLNAPELLRMYGSMFGLGGEVLEKRIRELLELVDMWERRDYRVANYSRGMRQRVGVAQALINDPDLLFFDEPTSGLDPIGAKDIREVVLELRKRGKTVFLCSHLLKEMEPLCDDIAILARGQLIIQGSVEKLLARDTANYRVEAMDLDDETLAALKERSTDLMWLDDAVRALFADRQSAFDAAAMIEDRGAHLLTVGPDRRTLEEVFIEAVGEESNDETDL
ncbi:MAG: ABC transporter ATP-binding protein [candidate division WS1 bacterium]|nr:ABC transporter ATP-binding protein [candidate division WS1 bacterium]